MKPCELNFTRFFSIFVCMKKLNDIELEELSYFPTVIYEEVIRPERKTPLSKKEKINNKVFKNNTIQGHLEDTIAIKADKNETNNAKVYLMENRIINYASKRDMINKVI